MNKIEMMVIAEIADPEVRDQVLEALRIKSSVPCGYTIEEIIARNIMAWETSKDKTDGMLPEIYLTDKAFFKSLTGLEPTRDNLKKYYKDIQ
jgi:hypothetical protein